MSAATHRPGEGGTPATGRPPDREAFAAEAWRLVEVIARLRAPDGCPWDREQTLRTIRPYTLEECHELLEAIDEGNDAAIVEELGDLLLQVVLYAQIASDEGRFDLVPVLRGIADKMVRRHPHVFGDAVANDAAQVLTNWERVKGEEKRRESPFEGIPRALPALARAQRLLAKAERAGLVHADGDRLAELRAAVEDVSAAIARDPHVPRDDAVRASREALAGRMLSAAVQVCRAWGVNAEDALRTFNAEFERTHGGERRS